MSMLSTRFGHIGHYVRNLSDFYARILVFDFDFVGISSVFVRSHNEY